MAFSTRVKEDLTRVMSSKPCCRRAEFVAFFLINGRIRLGGGLSLVMRTENAAAARKMFTLAKDFGLEREISVYRRARLRRNQVYTLLIPPQDKTGPFLAEVGMLEESGALRLDFFHELRKRILRDSCCRRAFLRGAFLASGSVSTPEGGSYHLEIDGLDRPQADLLVELMAELGVIGKTVRRKDRETVYLKGAEQISDFLSLIGSHRSMLEFESVRVTKEVRNQANRLRNCDTANINKTVDAAWRQVEEINRIISEIGLEKLPKKLRETAELRLENREASLTELAEISGLGRSALNHRLRRLSRIADNISAYGAEQWDKD